MIITSVTISLPFVLLVWFAHWIGDFVTQTDQMARGKSVSNRWLTIHCATYTMWLGGILLPVCWLWFNAAGLLCYVVVNGALHWVTDYITSRRNARMWAAGQVHEFFVGVGLDQAIHLGTLLITARWLMEA